MKNATIRIRLTLWYGLALCLILVIFAGVIYVVMSKAMRDEVDASLEEAAAVAVKTLGEHRFGPFLIFEDLSQDFPELALLDKFFQIFGPAGQVTIQSANIQSREIPLSRTAFKASLNGQATFESVRFDQGVPFRLLSVPIRHGERLVYILRVGTSLQPTVDMLDRLLLALLIASPLAVIVSLLGGWFLAGRALRPVDSITHAAQRIAAGDLTQRITAPSAPDEIGRLASTFNDMIARLEVSFRQIRLFSADASHELRTPLTITKGETELALRRPRSAEDYRQVLESNLEEIDRMSRIVDELLFLSRADLGEIKLKQAPVQLDDLLRDVQQQALVLGKDRQVETVVKEISPMMVSGDELRLRELFLNLIDNAIKYSHPGDTVEMSLVPNGEKGEFIVKDKGIGISLEDQPRIFDRFYRTDSARSHSTKGTGLGLSICKWIVETHKGAIHVQSMPNQGSSFTVLLPLSPSIS
ncbi:MAG: heavy metal sensor histidine kinase [Nitrospirales bacterium]|nr:heavy metal sensor histidine kinase [Nitrospirales bacterium]